MSGSPPFFGFPPQPNNIQPTWMGQPPVNVFQHYAAPSPTYIFQAPGVYDINGLQLQQVPRVPRTFSTVKYNEFEASQGYMRSNSVQNSQGRQGASQTPTTVLTQSSKRK